MQIAPMTPEDIPAVLHAWPLTFDPVTPERLQGLIFGDPNYEPEAVSLARDDHGAILGLSSAVLRRTTEGKDGCGAPYGFDRGFLKLFFVTPGPHDEIAARALLGAAESYSAAAGKVELRVTQYTGPYLYPGMDVRYERLRELLTLNGYRDVATIEDVAVALDEADIAARLARARDRVGSDVEVLQWVPELLEPMRAFVAEGQMPQWFPVDWEAKYAEPDDTTLILRIGGEILGWSHYFPGLPRSGFGPILVLPRARGRAYGVLLLLECMDRARRRGASLMSAGWANTGFYVAAGWYIRRRFAVFTKPLGTT
jgi:GNAT superfamily N-acetyltransferase